MITELIRRLAYLCRRRRFDDGLDNEVRFHLECRAEELEAAGLTHAAAVAQARREFGSAGRMSEEARAAWQIRWLEDLVSDLRYAARAFRRNPAFALTAVACLALGVGANTTMFSITTELLFSRPSVSHPESVAGLEIGGNSHATARTYRFLREARIFEDLSGENEEVETNWRDGAVTRRLYAFRVTPNFFDFTGMPVLLGRPPRESEVDTVVLSYSLWQRAFAGDPAVIGRPMVLDGRIYRIAAVLPRDHRSVIGFGFSPDIYYPADEKTYVQLLARLPAGMTRGEALGRVLAAARELDRIYPSDNPAAQGIRVIAISGLARLQDTRQVLPIAAFFVMLMLVVGLVLLIACANVAGLLLARASSRSHELAIRLSIGAGRGRLIRQLLAESLLLPSCGTAVGLALNFALTTFVTNMRLPLPIPFQLQVRPDWRLLGYAAVVALGTATATGLLPALRATRAGVSAALKSGPQPRRGWRLRNGLVVGQLAVSIVLLSMGSVFVRNLMLAAGTRPGFDVEHTVWSYMRLVPESYGEGAKVRALASAALEQLRGLPGVESASVAYVVPLNSNLTRGTSVQTDLSPQGVHLSFKVNYVAPGYFRTMDIPILQGRDFTASDGRGGTRVAIINENAARRLFGTVDPIGRIVRWPEDGPMTIVGVARNSKYFTLGESDTLAWYEPYLQTNRPGARVHFLVRAAGRPEPLVPAIDAILGRFDSTAAIETKPMSKALVFALLPSRFGAAILGSMGVLGLTLATVGLYGALLFSVSRRIREIGLRMALGATPREILGLVVRQSAVLVLTGIGAGTGLSVLAVRPLAMFLIPEVRPADPANFALVGVVLGLAALAATLSPAVRALRIDPVAALRHE
jgi:putative ABC transport system permease protein